MLTQSLDTFKENLKDYLALIVIKMLIAVALIKLLFTKLSFNEVFSYIMYSNSANKVIDVKVDNLLETTSIVKIILFIILIFIFNIIFSSYILNFTKSLLKNEDINRKEIFKESTKYYKRLIGIRLLFDLILIGLFICMFVVITLGSILGIIFAIGIFIYLVYVAITFEILPSYLIYHDEDISFTFTYGRRLAKSEFLNIFMFLFVASIIELLTRLTFVQQNFVLGLIITIITSVIGMFSYVFYTVICRQKDLEEKQTLGIEDDDNSSVSKGE